jgi:hypothetical protein
LLTLDSGRKEVNIYGVVHEIHAEIGSFTGIEIPELHQELGLG